MHQDVAALLAVQEDDSKIHELETRLAELRPRLGAMAAERDKAIGDRQQALAMAKTEYARALTLKVAEFLKVALSDPNSATA